MAKTLGSLSIGTRVELKVNSSHHPMLGQKIVFRVMDKNHATYPASSVTLMTDTILAIMAMDAKEPRNGITNRAQYGNNRYLYSNIHQWLNSSAAAGKWYSPQHSVDEPPIDGYVGGPSYAGWPGFLAGFSQRFIDSLLSTQFSVASHMRDGSVFDTVNARFFLPSLTETGLSGESEPYGNSKYAAFTDDNSRKAMHPTASRYCKWYVRTAWNLPDLYSECYRAVNDTGAIMYGTANMVPFGGGIEDIGIRPACNVLASAPVSDVPNTDGNYEFAFNAPPTSPAGISVPTTCYSNREIGITWGASTDPDGDAITYHVERSPNGGAYTSVTTTAGTSCIDMVSPSWNTIAYRVKAVDTEGNESAYMTSGTCAVIHNQPPVITGEDGDLGEALGVAYYDYSVTDADGDLVDVTEAVDGTVYKTHTVDLGITYRATIDGDRFVQLSNGQHNLLITATDSVGNATSRRMTFSKRVDRFTVELATPFETTKQPTRANIFVHRQIPAGAVFTVEVCNNPFDLNPVWEDASRAVMQGTAHVFANTSQHDVACGWSLRIIVERRGAIGECWMSGIGGGCE